MDGSRIDANTDTVTHLAFLTRLLLLKNIYHHFRYA
jgi:hypothetical protein